MKKTMIWIAGLAVLAGSADLAHSAKKKTADKQGDRKERAGEAKAREPRRDSHATSFTDSMERLDEAVKLQETQKTKLQEMRGLRDKALAKWDAANDKRLEAARARLGRVKGSAARKQVRAGMKRIEDQRALLAARHERDMFAVLTEDQRGLWNGSVLNQEVSKEFRFLSLAAEQDKKVLSLCTAEGKRQIMPVTVKTHDRLIKGLKRRVYQGVLTVQQRQRYEKARRPEGKDKPRKTKTRK